MDDNFLTSRIKVVKASIISYENALLDLGAAGAIQSYVMDTTQSRQSVTRADIPRIQSMVTSLYNQLATLEARQCGGAMTAGPAW